MGIKINIKHTLSDEFLMDVMITMVETPPASWFKFIDVNRREDLMITDFTVVDQEDIFEYQEDLAAGAEPDEPERHLINPQKVADAIERLLSADMVSRDIADAIARGARDNDAGDIDAIGADCILQIACFDEVLYG
jgi:hypothetical protein